MNIFKKTKTLVACLLSMTLLAGMGAVSAFAEEGDAATANPNRYEAENGSLVGSAAIVTTPTAGIDVSGGAFVGSLGQNNGFVELYVTVEEAGEREVTFAYCSMEVRSIDVSVNMGDYVNFVTDSNNVDWNGSVITTTTTLYLNAGENSLYIGCVAGWAPNVDYVEIGEITPDAVQAAVTALEAEVANIPAEVTEDTLATVEALVGKYNGLSADQKASLSADAKTAFDAAVAALDAYNNGLEEAEDKAAADSVTAAIEALGEITADSKKAIANARSAYDALSDTQKAFVSAETLNKLVKAEEDLAAIEANGGKAPTTTATTNTANNSDSDDGSSAPTVIIIVAIAAVVVIGVVVAIVVVRKKKN